ncbi:MAG TPA: hypothetical protein VKT82_16035 [Ktedonobacterales bacterium]|nr:hypothetical protein [Ktedonobacterales bacterium]
MSSNGPSRQCPRCGTLLFDEMPFCRACGWQFAPADSVAAPPGMPPSEYIPYDGPDQTEDMPVAQPDSTLQQPGAPFPNQTPYAPATLSGWLPPTAGGYAPGQMGTNGYATAPLTAAPARRFPRALILIALIVLLLGTAAGGIFLSFHPAPTASTPIFDRHGLQANVPLPDHTAFAYKHTVTQGTLTADEWIWKVTQNEPASLQQFYQKHLPQYGWTHLQMTPGDTLGVIGCQGEQVLVIGISKHLHDSNDSGPATITDAPAGGSALGIALTSNQAIIQGFCETAQP